jgi:CHAT domain-containing protein/tetratricopeptide (TPR) repeat protein
VPPSDFPPELAALLSELSDPPSPDQVPGRIDVCRRALALVDRAVQPAVWVRLRTILATLLVMCPTGPRAERIEEAVAVLRETPDQMDRQAHPALWATAQLDLAGALVRRTDGDRAAHTEEAIRHYELAAEVFTREAFPAEWQAVKRLLERAEAKRRELMIPALERALAGPPDLPPPERAQVHLELAQGYSSRAAGDPTENQVRALGHFEAALAGLTPQANPVEWVAVHRTLAVAYQAGSWGDRRQDLTRALEHLRALLAVHDRDRDAAEWARLHHNLGVVLRDRAALPGGASEDFERALEHFHQALTIYTREAFPREWGRAEHALGTAHLLWAQAAPAENAEEAIRHLTAALAVRARAGSPHDWAGTQSNLGSAYLLRVGGTRGDNVERALEHLSAAAEVLTAEATPAEYGILHRLLADAWEQRCQGDPEDNRGRAIEHYEAVLSVTGREAAPGEWADMHRRLAMAYIRRRQGDGEEDLRRGAEHCRAALEDHDPTEPPAGRAGLLVFLAMACQDRKGPGRASRVEEAIGYLNEALALCTEQEEPQLWGAIHERLGNAYHVRGEGDPADNREQAIGHYEASLRVNTPWDAAAAAAHLELGNLYFGRQRGDPGANADRSLEHFEKALEVTARRGEPEDAVEARLGVGTAYLDLVHGNPADNIDRAIDSLRQALVQCPRETHPRQWAWTQTNLGKAFGLRPRGDRAANLEQSLKHLLAALEAYPRAEAPADWALVHSNLSGTYSNRLRGERSANLEQAIEHLRLALEVYTRDAFPERWAVTMHNLASAYSLRLQGNRAENLTRAVEYYEATLTVLTRAALPVYWAKTHNNLASVYLQQAEGLEPAPQKALEHLRLALEVHDRTNMPFAWAEDQLNLGHVHSLLPGDKGAAVHHYQQALEVFTRGDHPEQWATTHHNLAQVYLRGFDGGDRQARAAAREHLTLAGEVFTRETFPFRNLLVEKGLAALAFGEERWAEAHAAFARAIAAGDALLAEAYTEAGRQLEVGETAQLHANAAFCLIQLGQHAEALLCLEQGKARLLAEALALDEAAIGALPPELQRVWGDARTAVHTLEAEMRLPSPAARPGTEVARELSKARATLRELIAAARARQPEFFQTALGLDELLALVPAGGAMVAPLLTEKGGAVFVLPAGLSGVGADCVLSLKKAAVARLLLSLNGTARRPGWLKAYGDWLQGGQLGPWLDTVARCTRNLWNALLGPVHQRLAKLGLKQGAPATLMVPGELGLLPLHAAWRPVGGAPRAFLDEYTVSYTPSAYTLQRARHRLRNPPPGSATLLAVVSPGEDLVFAPVEGAAVAALFPPPRRQVLSSAATTAEDVCRAAPKYSYFHFTGHGYYDWDDPMGSGLVIGPGQRLTLRRLLSGVDLGAARLVTLSACETGLAELWNSPDEYLGLPAGFLLAGAPGVVGTLWAVNDLSTMLLVAHFYELHLNGSNPAAALREAQLWLRDVSAGKLTDYFAAARARPAPEGAISYEQASYCWRRFLGEDPDERPFQHPFFWGAFTLTGL